MNSHVKQVSRSILARLPESVQLGIVSAYGRSKVRQFDRLETPTILTYFITNRCNERCDHCFYWKDLNVRVEELTIDEIEKMVGSLKHPVSVSYTGGEPFIRPDVAEISRLFNRVNGCRVIGIATNATLAEKTIGGCREILETCDLDRLNVQISLDGLRETHDKIRRIPRAFDRTIDVMRELLPLRDEFPCFRPSINFCIQRDNVKEIEAFVAQMRPFDVPIKFAVIRGNSYGTYALAPEVQAGVDPKDMGTAELSPDELEDAARRIDELDRGPQGGFWTDMERRKIDTTVRMIRTGQRQVPCYNGRTEAVIYPTGDFSMCELTKPIGNLRDFDLDVAKIWRSDAANRMRDPISKCYCIHGCSLVTSLGLQPELLLQKILDKNPLSDTALRGGH
ncbi:MAG: radical SAM protein [Planctomycetes bacterium]|nr:radical SAM protein [Planctomycetota bacterium]MBI3845878.1 radical SAM protein [Planctomycetota bacterium]